LNDEDIAESVRLWVQRLVVDLNLCPFAKRELVKGRVRFAVTPASTPDQLLASLQAELERLAGDPSIATSLLIHPHVLQDFHAYNQFLDAADAMLERMQLDGVYQIASFHPDYQFAGTAPDDVENYTNRSPYPLLHLLREDSVEQAVAGYPDIEQIPARNIALMHRLGHDALQKMFASFLDVPAPSAPTTQPE